jgi:hypothetical protein
MKPPIPLSKAFLVCNRVVHQDGEISLMKIARRVISRYYPAGMQLGLFAQWTSAHGDYRVEAQLHTMAGEVVWREGPPETWSMPDPLDNYNLALNLTVVFPAPGLFEVVLLANGEEIARQKLKADLAPEQKDV